MKLHWLTQLAWTGMLALIAIGEPRDPQTLTRPVALCVALIVGLAGIVASAMDRKA